MTNIIVDENYKKEREVRIKFKNDLSFFSYNCLKIRPKDGGLVSLRLNKAQSYLHDIIEKQKKEKGYVRIICLKGRQQGCSTYVGARFFWKVIHNKGIKSFILTHRNDATDNLFKMTQRYYQHLPDNLKPYVDRKNAKELSFTLLDSGYKVGTAGAGAVGRSDTIQLFHGSEVGLWENADEIVSGVMQAIPKESEIILESTAKGMGNFFHKQWMLAEKGESSFIPVFIPFYWQSEYSEKLRKDFSLTQEETELRGLYNLTNETMQWRKTKIAELGENLFKQEYPFSPTEAFNASAIEGIIPSFIVERARKNTSATRYGVLMIGVDPARNDGGGDRTSIICRQGRVAFDLKSFKTNDLMHIVGIIVNMIKEYQKDNEVIVCVDCIGLGAGVIDRLRELGYSKMVKSINVGESAYNQERFRNKKSEIWQTMKEWLQDYPCKIPDVDSLHTDLCAVNFSYNSNSQLVMETKESMKSRGLDSPDEAEALAMTFAFPIVNISVNKKPYSKSHVWTI